MTDDAELKRAMERLLPQPEFKTFLFAVIQRAGIFNITTDGSDGRNLVAEGRRNLGLEILDMAELGQPVSHPDKLPILSLIQTLVAESQKQSEKPNGKRERYDRNADLDDQADAA